MEPWTGAESPAKGIRTCALFVLTTIAITDHRDPVPGSSSSSIRSAACNAARRAVIHLVEPVAVAHQPVRELGRLISLTNPPGLDGRANIAICQYAKHPAEGPPAVFAFATLPGMLAGDRHLAVHIGAWWTTSRNPAWLTIRWTEGSR